MATNSGYRYVDLGTFTKNGKHNEIYRQIFWVRCVFSAQLDNEPQAHRTTLYRYIYWTVTTPLIFLCLSLLAGLPWLDIIALFVANIALILTMAFSAFHHNYRSAYVIYILSTLLFLYTEKLLSSFEAQNGDGSSLHAYSCFTSLKKSFTQVSKVRKSIIPSFQLSLLFK